MKIWQYSVNGYLAPYSIKMINIDANNIYNLLAREERMISFPGYHIVDGLKMLRSKLNGKWDCVEQKPSKSEV